MCYQTITSYLSACRYYQIAAGFPDPSFSSFPQLAYVLKGVRRSSSSPRRHRLPVTPAMLEAILAAWSRAPFTFDQTMLWAAFCLAFFAFLRAGEFTCPSIQSFDPSSMLSADDIGIDSHSNPRHMTVRLKRSKCDPFGAGIVVHVGRTYKPLCPVAAVLSYLAVRPSTPGPLFVFADGSPLSRSGLVSSFSRALRSAGMDPGHCSGHSFRIGAATAAAAAGLSDSLIQTMGRWKSGAFLSYIRTPSEVLCTASAALSG